MRNNYGKHKIVAQGFFVFISFKRWVDCRINIDFQPYARVVLPTTVGVQYTIYLSQKFKVVKYAQ